jgi:hypothetical protein
MKRWNWKWLGAGLVGSVLVMGCRHCRECECECCWPVTETVEKKPEFSEGNVAITSVTHTLPPVVETKKPAAHPPTIAMTVEAPDAGGSGSIAGTMEFTAEEAEAMGIRPGYTPGALYLTPKSSLDPTVVKHADHSEGESKSENAVPVKGEK